MRVGGLEKLSVIGLGIWISLMFGPSYLVLAGVLAGLVYYYKSAVAEFSFWEKQNIPGPGSEQAFPFGSAGEVLSQPLEFDIKMIGKYGKIVGYHEMLGRCLLVADPELLRRIFIKDFNHFINRQPEQFTSRYSLFGNMFIAQRDDRWKELRNTMTPVFTSGKLKHMPFYISQSLQRLNEKLVGYLGRKKDVPLKETVIPYMLDTIAAITLALDIKAQTEEDNPFVKHSRSFLTFSFADIGMLFQILAPNFSDVITGLTGISLIKNSDEKFFRTTIKQIIDQRKENPLVRPDFLQLIINSQQEIGSDIKDNAERDPNIEHEEVKKGPQVLMSEDEMIAQIALFLVAGFDSTSATIEFMLYELSLNQEIQDRCREEVMEHCGDTLPDKFTYDQIMELNYVAATLSETQRKYPTGFRILRYCNKEITYADYGLTIPSDTNIVAAVYSIHRDPKNYSEPEKFDPERFLGDAKTNRDPFTYMPFGAGPRNCIGMRFAQLTVRYTMAYLLSKYRILPCAQTPPEPLNLEITVGTLLKPKDNILLKFEKL